MSAEESFVETLLSSLRDETAPSADVPPKAVAWARVSTQDQADRGLSIPEQLREVRVYAEQHDIEIVEEFTETGSAFKKQKKRVEFHRMIAAAKANPEVSIVLVHDISRFSRDSIQGKSLVRELRGARIRVVSLNDPDIDPETVAGVYMEAITFAKNEAYSREVAFHTRKGCRANVNTRDPETGWCFSNGGQPIFGYRTEHLERGGQRRGRPVIKSIWVPDDTEVAGRPVHEWAHHCLTKLAAKGASLDDLRDFCNDNSIPARRGGYWSSSTWNSLLQPNALLKYSGYGVWNVHRKNGTKRPPSEWVIVENAHEALITEEEAKAIAAARQSGRRRRFDVGYATSRNSRYLLSGGLFKCQRCGSNMTGLHRDGRRYYVCGSQPYRRGKGCGPGVYVPQALVESEVIEGLSGLLGACADPKGFTRQVNAELRQMWEESTGYDPRAVKKLEAIDGKIANIRRAIEDGLEDAAWANGRVQQLLAERKELEQAVKRVGEPPQINVETAISYRRQTERVLAQGDPAERKDIIRKWVDEIKLAPERYEVDISYRIPEPVVNAVVARAGFEPATSRL